jgi:MFS family permease
MDMKNPLNNEGHRFKRRRLMPSRMLLLAAVSVTALLSDAKGLSLTRKRHVCNHLLRSSPQRVYRQPQPWRIRGGALSLTPTSPPLDSNFKSDNAHNHQRGMAAALFSTYFCVMGAKCALPSVLSLLLHPSTGLDFSAWSLDPQHLFSRQLTIATMSVAFGKLLLGPVIDAIGGIASLKIALTALCMLLLVIAQCNRFMTFAICWVFVDFIFSSCWAACISAIHQCFPQEEWAKRVGTIAAAARTGNAAAFSLFAVVLRFTTNSSKLKPWRLVFFLSAILQLVPISLLTYYGRFYKDAQLQESSISRPSLSTSISCLKRVAVTPEFWLHLTSRSALMVFGSFLLFVPTLFTNCYGATNAFAAQVGSIFALGCLLSVTFGSQLYATLDKPIKMTCVISSLTTATFCALAQLAHVKGTLTLSANASAALLFLWGFCFAIPFYIPPSLYALSRGGKTSSATIADVFDFGGFGLLAVFNGYVASIRHEVLSAWIPTFEILTACSLVSLVTLSLAIYLE